MAGGKALQGSRMRRLGRAGHAAGRQGTPRRGRGGRGEEEGGLSPLRLPFILPGCGALAWCICWDAWAAGVQEGCDLSGVSYLLLNKTAHFGISVGVTF